MPIKTLSKLLQEHEDSLFMANEPRERHRFPSGILQLNYAIGDPKGIPGGTLIQLIGDPKNGKTTLSFDLVAHAQRSGIKELEIPIGGNKTRAINAAFVDFERSFEPEYAKALGVDIDKLLLIKTKFGEQSFNIVEALLDEGLQMVVIDSIPAFVPQSEDDKDLTENEKMASMASVLSRVIKRQMQLADHADALVILINQWRANMAMMARSDKKPFGSRAVHHWSKITIELKRIKNEDVRSTVELYVSRTKFGPEGQKIHADLVFGKGFDYDNHILTLAIDHGIVKKGGAWYEYNGMKAQGKEGAIEKFDMQNIRAAVIEALEKES